MNRELDELLFQLNGKEKDFEELYRGHGNFGHPSKENIPMEEHK